MDPQCIKKHFTKVTRQIDFQKCSLSATLVIVVVATQGCQTPIYKTTASVAAPDVQGRAPVGINYFLPRSEIRIIGKYEPVEKGSEKKNFVITIMETRFPDASAPRFSAIMEHPIYDEDTKIVVQNGLLNSSNTKPRDQTPEIFRAVVSGALNFAGLPPIASFVQGGPGKQLAPDPFDFTFDPLVPANGGSKSPWEVDLNNTFKVIVDMKSVTDCPPSSESTPNPGDKSGEGNKSKESTAVSLGLAFRPLRPVEIKIRERTAGSANIIIPDKTFLIPDNSRVEVFPVTRGLFTQRETDVVFKDGIPEQIHLKQPSPVLSVIRLPLDLLKSVSDALPAIIKVQYPNQAIVELETIRNQNAILEQQIKKVEMDSKLRDLGNR